MATTTPGTNGTTDASMQAALIDRIRGIAPVIRENAPQGEQERRTPDAAIQALEEIGALRVLRPKRYQGSEVNVREFLDISAAIAEADGGIAWTATLLNLGSWTLNLFSERASEEVYAQTPEAKLSGVLMPSGTARRVPGGYRVNGKWFYTSGVWNSDWVTVGVIAEDEDGQPLEPGVVLIPRSDYTIDDTWFVAGMRASGSACTVAEDVFVPEHRYISTTQFLTADYFARYPDAPIYRAALAPFLAIVLVGPQLGLARTALDLVTSKAATKAIAYTVFQTQRDSVAFQLQVAKAAMKIDTAHLHAYRAADELDRHARLGELPDLLSRARFRGDVAVALESVTSAIDMLISAHGAGSFAETSQLQRIWRDSNVAARHAVLLPEVGYEIFGKALLGVDEQITPLL